MQIVFLFEMLTYIWDVLCCCRIKFSRWWTTRVVVMVILENLCSRPRKHFCFNGEHIYNVYHRQYNFSDYWIPHTCYKITYIQIIWFVFLLIVNINILDIWHFWCFCILLIVYIIDYFLFWKNNVELLDFKLFKIVLLVLRICVNIFDFLNLLQLFEIFENFDVFEIL